MSRAPITLVQLLPRSDSGRAGSRVAEAVRRDLGVELGAVEHRRVFAVVGEVEPRWLLEAATAALADPLLHEVRLGSDLESELTRFVLVSRLPGVTDDEGSSAHTALADYAGRSLEELRVFAQDLFLIEAPLDAEVLTRVAREGLGNPLVHFFLSGPLSAFAPYAPMVELAVDPTVFSVSLDLDDEQLAQLARERVLHLDLAELRAIRAYFARTQTRSRRSEEGLPSEPTDVELEVFAQTWSEHCKHKEFQAEIQYVDTHRGERFEVNGLFDTYIRAATRKVCDELEAHGQSWVVKVFSDNAGVVRVDEERLFVFKVETHNTPSALDPYGGAITGILGNNRDPLGTGIGGARLLFNTDVLCFGPPDYGEPLLPGQLHPARVMRGVIKGIEDGGNKSGVPTVHGAIVFDGRFSGKPLVYCGTGALVPSTQAGRPAWVKAIEPGDRIVMVGGRVGQDGIHGATFSSAGIDENSPRTAVQVGSPFTQKKVADLLVEACDRGLVRCTTDNGAGGLSSSVGELATLSGGARVELAHVPLKYPGLRPWEILVSESQERMTLAVSPDHLDELFELATELEVEASDVGEFTDSGLFEVLHAGKRVALLDLEFLHDGVPRKRLQAEWVPPTLEAPSIPGPQEAKSLLLTLLESLDIRSREEVIRRYDHEVKGLSVVKALMGGRMRSPQDAAVLRLDHHGQRGLAVSCGICPRFGDLSPYTMSALAFDEAVRQIIAVGGRLPRLDDPKGPWWSACDNFCVPDSVFDSIRNPDGKQKLAALVQMCRALYDVSTEYLVPLTSGKDSMKNDFVSAGRKISVPPTILYSVVAGLDDVDRVVTTELKAGGDFVYLLGETRDELGGSCLLRLSGQLGDEVPRLRPAQARALYVRVGEATRMGLLESCHDLSDGGLGVALAEATFGASLGAEIELAGELGLIRTLFSESPSRFVVSVRPENRTSFEAHFASMATPLGRVTEEPRLTISSDGFSFEVSISELYSAWTRGLGV